MQLVRHANFDAFNTNETQNLITPMGNITEFFQLLYLAEMKVAVFCAVIAVVLLGISFVIHSKSTDFAINKKWAIRIAGLVLLIFSLGGIVGIVWRSTI